MEISDSGTTGSWWNRGFKLVLILIALGAIVFWVWGTTFLNTPHPLFPVDTDIEITEGLTQDKILTILKEAHIIRSTLYLQSILQSKFPESFIQAGTYRFTEKLTAEQVAEAITHGLYRSPHISITFPEGFSAKDFLSYLPKSFVVEETFDATQYEGYLFPDTYFVTNDMSADAVLTLLRDNFTLKLAPYQARITASGFTEEEVIILASIIEREAKNMDSKKLVSGILHNRLQINMPLQVDAVFDYILDKASHELTTEDLELDSPYNTYLHTGLPPTPIANPGLEAIEAVLGPTQSKYLYYLTDEDGNFYYATTFEEHKQNKARYLR